MTKKQQPTIFHFNCPLCGSNAPEIPVQEYLTAWSGASKNKIDTLFEILLGMLNEMNNSKVTWKSKEFIQAIEFEMKLLNSLPVPQVITQEKKLISSGKDLVSLFDCPLCGIPNGKRDRNKYFSEWDSACKVQTANLLYEAGIVIFAFVRSLPQWASPEYLGKIGKILEANYNSQKALGLMECPFCARFTNCLYGEGTEDNPHRCRWCFDRGGGMSVGLALRLNAEELVKYMTDPLMLEIYIRQNTLDIANNGVPDGIIPGDVVPRYKKDQRNDDKK